MLRVVKQASGGIISFGIFRKGSEPLPPEKRYIAGFIVEFEPSEFEWIEKPKGFTTTVKLFGWWFSLDVKFSVEKG